MNKIVNTFGVKKNLPEMASAGNVNVNDIRRRVFQCLKEMRAEVKRNSKLLPTFFFFLFFFSLFSRIFFRQQYYASLRRAAETGHHLRHFARELLGVEPRVRQVNRLSKEEENVGVIVALLRVSGQRV
jgi:hypothetical protein